MVFLRRLLNYCIPTSLVAALSVVSNLPVAGDWVRFNCGNGAWSSAFELEIPRMMLNIGPAKPVQKVSSVKAFSG